MNSKIQLLDNDTINKIAAGEVVENPRSIVKELIENSIDAGANEIIVEIKGGGKKLVRITDNGSGINKDEIEEAFKRHFTSKISKAEDLSNLYSLGFRGEALASIAAVSRVEVISRTKNEQNGVKIVIEGGIVTYKDDIGCPVGTTISVTELFFNVPARKKFLKSDTSESANINEIVTSLALCKGNITFKYVNNGSVIFKTPKTNNILNTISSLYEKDLYNSLINVDYKGKLVSITGFVTNLNYYRGNRKYQLVFVNGRYIKHKKINYYIEAAYTTMLPKSKYPACFLNINISPKNIDVNVHPAKTEIRIKDEELFLKEIRDAIYKALMASSLIKEIKKESIFKSNKYKEIDSFENSIFENEDEFVDDTDEITEESFREKYINFINNNSKNKQIVFENKDEDINITNVENNINLKEKSDIKNNENKNYIDDTNYSVSDNMENLENVTDIFIDNMSKSNDMENSYEYENVDKEVQIVCENVDENNYTSNNIVLNKQETFIKEHDNISIPELDIIGVLFGTYIMCENKKNCELFMIDQHAAHERINYEKFLSQYETNNILKQELIIPEIINLSYEDYYTAINMKDIFSNIGMPIESFGVNSIIINSIPVVFCNGNIKDLFFTILDSLKDIKGDRLNLEIGKIIKNACVKSVKSGDKLHMLEISKLLNDLQNTKNPYTCPHGRPVIIKMTKYEIERMFERIQI